MVNRLPALNHQAKVSQRNPNVIHNNLAFLQVFHRCPFPSRAGPEHHHRGNIPGGHHVEHNLLLTRSFETQTGTGVIKIRS